MTERRIGRALDLERLAYSVYEAGYTGNENQVVRVSNCDFFRKRRKLIEDLAEYLLNEPGAASMTFDMKFHFEELEVEKQEQQLHRSTEVVALSGGMDSLASYFMMDDPVPVFVDYGQKHLEREQEMVRSLDDDRLIEMELRPGRDIVGEEPVNLAWAPDSFKVPARNFVLFAALSSFGAYYGEPVELAIGVYEGEIKTENRDKSVEFFSRVGALFSQYFKTPVRTYSPVSRMTKGEVADELVGEIDNLFKIPFCDSGNRCGECKSCVNFSVAIDQSSADITHDQYESTSTDDFLSRYPTFADWMEHVANSPMGDYYAENIDEYDGDRKREIEGFLNAWRKQ
jgi:7-cyano-7-deazaguanine synthase in queuosine biosynthesis